MKTNPIAQPGHKCPTCRQIVPEAIPTWWHWLIVRCMECGTQSQQPVSDDIGEDCNLYAKVDEAKACGDECCGKRMQVLTRHALADYNCLTKDGEPVRKASLLPDQNEGDGTFMDEAEYERRLQGAKLGAVILANVKAN